MASLNKCMFIGNLGRDPEIKFIDNGNAVANFSIACNEKWKDKASGEQKEHVEWVRVVAWGKLATLCGEYLKKGRPVFVEGKMKTRKWTDKNGVEKYTTEVVADGVTFLGGKEGGSESAPIQSSQDNDDDVRF